MTLTIRNGGSKAVSGLVLRNALADAAVDCLELATDEPLDEALLRFTQLRKRRSQLSSGAVPRHLRT